MSVYKCSVINEVGKQQNISRDAESRSELVGYLKQNNYIIIDINKSESSINLSCFNKTRIKSKDLSVFCKQLYAMIKVGADIANSLDILRQQTDNKRLAKIIVLLYEDLQKGNTFSESLSHHKYAFPSILLSMVEAGELSGSIDVIMNRLSTHFEKEYKIENKVKGAMTYPIILIIVSIAVVIFLLTAIIPTFVEIYSSSGMELPKATLALISSSDGLIKYWYLIIPFIASIVLLISAIGRNKNVKLKVDFLKLHIPVIKNLVLNVETSRFTRTLSTLIGNGVPLLQALETVAGVSDNTYICSIILGAKEDVKRGQALSQSLKNQGVFQPMVYSMIRIGEDSGSIEEILDKVAEFCDEEVDTLITKLTSMIEPLMIVFMAIIIGFVVIAMITPMFDMIKIIN